MTVPLRELNSPLAPPAEKGAALHNSVFRWTFCLLIAVLGGTVPGSTGGKKTEPMNRKLSGPVKEFRIVGAEGEIRPDTILARRGDRLLITFESRDGRYEIRMKDFGIKKDLQKSETITLELVPTRTGIFKFRFSKNRGFGRRGLNGKIVVR